MTRFLKTALFLLLLASFVPPALAQDAEHMVKIRLVAEHGLVKPGETFQVGIEESIAPGWHTYWKNPGDSGTAPLVRWNLPPGFQAKDMEWPVPSKLSIGPLTNYGYEGNVILLQTIKAPDSLPEAPLTLNADIEVLVCQEQCIPEYGTYQLTLNGPESEAEDNTAYFTQARDLLPKNAAWNAIFKEDNGYLVIEKSIDWSNRIEGFEFIPEDWGVIANAAPPEIKQVNNNIIVRQKRGERPLAMLKEIKGLLAWSDNEGKRHAYSFAAHKEGAAIAADAPMPKTALLKILFLALLGGLILNLMPCVFPVLSIKALSLVKISEKHPEIARMHGLAYTAGVVLSFLFIAALLIAFRAAGAEIGWGFQLQNPVVVTLLAYLLFVIGMNFSGLFEISGRLGNIGNKLTQGEGIKSSFFTGILATLVATPCTAPFMAAAVGAALTQPPVIALIIFAALGFGLALPYLALSLAPTLQKCLPKPGAWMEKFRHIIALPMYASAIWLVWVLSMQAGPMGALAAVMGIVLIAIGIRLLRYNQMAPAFVMFAAALLLLPVGQVMAPKHMEEKEAANSFGRPYTHENLGALLAGNDPVFVEMTAAWCITCKINHAVAIDVASTRKVFTENNVQYLVGDWTLQDAKVTEYLNSFGRNGVPIYVFYGRRNPATGERPRAVILPQLLTPGIVADTIREK